MRPDSMSEMASLNAMSEDEQAAQQPKVLSIL
jgi:hypothetical protein